MLIGIRSRIRVSHLGMQRSVHTRCDATNIQINKDTSVEKAVRFAYESLGRDPGSAADDLAHVLRSNWYETAEAVASMNMDEADALKVPFRLCKQVQLLIGSDSQSSSRSTVAAINPDMTSNELNRPTEPRTHPVEPMSQLQDLLPKTSGGPSSAEAGSSMSSSAAVEPEDMMLRCAPSPRYGNINSRKIRTSARRRKDSYAIKMDNMSPYLLNQMAAFRKFCIQRHFGAQQDPISESTFKNYDYQIRCFLGWMHHAYGVPFEDISLDRAFPTPERASVAKTFDYMQWLIDERSVGARSRQIALHGIMQGAKFLFHSMSKVNPHAGESAYSDIEVVQELRAMLRDLKHEAKVAPSATDTFAKWLSWPDYLGLVSKLKAECAGRNWSGRPRNDQQVALSLQRYLIFAIMSCIPDRQRTLRELRLGSTLVKDDQGRWVIRHGPKDYKTGKTYGERPPLVIAPELFTELEAWLDTWRVKLEPQHDFVFTRPNGTPFTDASFSMMFSGVAFRITGKRTSPHLIRDMIVTHLRSGDASERELEALAIYMGHSIAMQRDSYDRRTKAQKVEPAVELLQLVNTNAGAANRGIKMIQ